MKFGKIDYLNLLPFYVYMKRNLKGYAPKSILHYKKGHPAQINREFLNRRIDGAFISSIRSFGKQGTTLGIVAKKEVLSVLVLPGASKSDIESETSNALAKILGCRGEVIIGDKALKAYYDGVEGIDLAALWRERTGLPFVFARLCFLKRDRQFHRMAKEFSRVKTHIPRYILNRYSNKTGISPENILHYLTKISYTIGEKEKRSLKIFERECRRKKLI